MSKIKRFEFVLIAAAALVNAARSLMKFVEYLKKLRQQKRRTAFA